MSWISEVPAVCVKCTGVGDAHRLTCPTLRAPARVAIAFDDGSGDEDVTE